MNCIKKCIKIKQKNNNICCQNYEMSINDDISKFLNMLGLSFTEIRIYTDLLSNPGSKIIDITKSTNLPRSTVKYNIEKLIYLGLVNITIKNKTKTYSVSNPKQIDALVDIVINKNKYLKEKGEKVISKITNIYEQNNCFKSTSRILESRNQIEGYIRGAIDANAFRIQGKIIRFFDNFGSLFQKVMDEYDKSQKKINVLYNHDEALKANKYFWNFKHNVRKSPIFLNSTIYSYNNRILLISYDPYLSGIFINNRDLFNLIRGSRSENS